jgi:tryptophan-rich sensory protein
MSIFGFGLFTAAALEILLLCAAIALTIRRFHGVDRPAAWLLVPYLLWVCFAVSLNMGIAVLN